MLKNYNIWPVNGCYYDQPAVFIQAINVCDTASVKMDGLMKEENARVDEWMKSRGGKHGR